MNLVSRFLVICATILTGSLASAAFPLQSIDCRDLFPTDFLDVHFTTHNVPPGGRPPQGQDSIAYFYGNTVMSRLGVRTGHMISNSAPDFEKGVFSLYDNYDIANPSKLILRPANEVGEYYGFLSGSIDKSNGWIKVSNYPLHCHIR